MYLRLGLHVQIRLYYVLPYKPKVSAQHGIGFILDRCIAYLGLTMPNLRKKYSTLKSAHFFFKLSIDLLKLKAYKLFENNDANLSWLLF